MSFEATKVKMSYEMARTLPDSDTTMIIYQNFLKQYGQDGCVIFVGIQDEKLYELEHFNAWYDLNESIREVEGVEECLSVTRMFDLKKNDTVKRFDLVQVVPQKPESQEELDVIKRRIDNLMMYEGLLFNSETSATLMMITVHKDFINAKSRIQLTYNIKDLVDKYSEDTGIKTCISGLPYIRTITTKKMEVEIATFIILSIVIATIILFLFFKSLKTVGSILVIVFISVICIFGTMGVFGYKVTILTGVLPPLLIIIGVENSIFLLNKYHREYQRSGDKMSALNTVIQRIGSANLLTNATTAASFASFIITGNEMLVQFGIISSINIFVTYILTLVMIPTLFSCQDAPKEKQINYLKNSKIEYILRQVAIFAIKRRKVVYGIVTALAIVCVIGTCRLHTTGSVVDDISKKDRLYKDLMFFEKHFNGVMPYEIAIDTKNPKGILKASFINKIQQLEDTLAVYPEFSAPLSIAEVVKFAKSSFFNGDKKYYSIPNNQEFNFILPYLPNLKGDKTPGIVKSFIDSDMQRTRVSVQMANVTTPKIDSINKSLKPKIAAIFPPDKYDVTITGNSIVFLEGTNYMIRNLLYSLLLAFIVIAILMTLTFRSFKMVMISMVPNLIPMLFTAGLMGFCGISIKTSSILIFSIALGISVDNTIHYLSRYRQQMKYNGGQVKNAVMSAITETCPSMISSATVLICGFLIFSFSSFGATQIVGYLVPFTLFIALITNLFVLPSLLLTFNRQKNKKDEATKTESKLEKIKAS